MSEGSALKGKFAQMRDAFAKAQQNPKSQQVGFVDKPDGKYLCMVTGAEITEAQSSGRLQINWAFTIKEGELAGQVIYDYQGLDKGEESFVFVFKRLKQFGIDPSALTIEELEPALDMIVAAHCECLVQLRTGKNKQTGEPFQNKYINQVFIGVGGVAVEEEPESDVSDEMKPTGPQAPFNIGDKVQFDLDGTDTVGLIKTIDFEQNRFKVFAGGKTHLVAWNNCTAA